MILQFELFEIALGLFLIYGILIVLQKIGNHNDYTAIISAFILLDVFFLVMAIGSHSGSEEVTIVYGLLQVLIISYVLYDNYKNQITEYFMFTKITGFITYAITSLFLPYYITYQLLPKADLLTDIEGYSSNNYTSFFVAFVCVSIFIFVIAASGYMTDWGDYEFQWFRKTDLLQDGTSVVFYIVTLSSMQLGLRLINSHHMDSVIEGLLLVLGILGIALLQSANLIKYYRQRSFVGVWMGFKYLILTWLILNALTNVGIASVLLSLSGLVVAILCIALGFHLEIKSLRLYGLILTIVMVVKFILVDLYQENSITRVISLLLGGIICLGITALYNMLNGELEKN